MDESHTDAIVAHDPTANCTDLLLDRLAATPDRVLFALPDGDGWRPLTVRAFHADVVAVAKGFIASGIAPGDRIGLMAKTRYEWTLLDFGAWFAGASIVPIYETSAPNQIRWGLGNAEVRAVIVETAEHFARFDEVHPDLPDIDRVWHLDRGDLDRLRATGSDVSDAVLEERRRAAQGADLATIIFTSGTTGQPKGCVLTHANFVDLARNSTVALGDVVGVPDASMLLFLPLAHVFARFLAVLCVTAGVRVGHQSDTSTLLPALATFRPTFLLAVPRVFEKVYNGAAHRAEASGRGHLFQKAADAAVTYSEALSTGSVPLGDRLRFLLWNALVFRKIRAALGGQVRWAVSGSAPLNPRLGHFFRALGVTILEGWGLTETTAPGTVNRPALTKVGTVGPAMPGVSLRIAPDGEVLIRGCNVFHEYWNDPAATATAFDGPWFRTGDLGSLDDDGYLTITGRKKEILVTAAGKNVAPAPLEDEIRSNPLVGQVVVVGERRPFIAAILTLDAEYVPAWLALRGEPAPASLADAAAHPLVKAEIQRAVDAANARVSRAESVRAFEILPVEFTEVGGQLTPKLTVKRHVVTTEYAGAIDALYAHAAAEHAAAHPEA